MCLPEGAAVRLKVDGAPVFFGFLFAKRQDKDGMIRLTAYDQLRYMNNKDTYIYGNKTASQFLKMLAADFKLQTGEMLYSFNRASALVCPSSPSWSVP